MNARRPPDATGRPIADARALVRITLATLSLYLLDFPVSAVFISAAALTALLGLPGVTRGVTVLWGKVTFWIMGRNLVVRGRSTIQAARPCIVVANHASLFDIPALMAAVPGIAIVGRDYLWRIPVLGYLLRRMRFVPIDTSSAHDALRAMAEAGRVAGEGVTVGIFPEGTRTSDGRLQALKRGFVRVLRASGRDLLPVTVSGTFALKPKGRLTADPREPIRVEAHEPLRHADLAVLSDEQIVRKVRAAMERAGAPPGQAGAPQGGPEHGGP